MKQKRSTAFPAVGSRGGSTAGGHYVPRTFWGSRLAPYAPEWASLPVGYLVPLIAHPLAVDPEVLPWVAAGMATSGVVLTGVTWAVGSERSPVARAHATITVGGVMTWLTTATIAGPWSTVLGWGYALAGVAVAASWSIRKALRKSGSEDGGGDGGFFAKIGLAGSRFDGDIRVAPNKVEATVQLPPGSTAADLEERKTTIASHAHLSDGAVRVTPDPDDVSRAQLTVVPKDMLKHSTKWPGLSSPGGSIMDPIVVGAYEDTEPLQFWLPGDPVISRNATHYAVNGMNGSGKTTSAKVAWAEIVSRRDAELVVLDPSKGSQSVGFLNRTKAKLVLGRAACKTYVKALLSDITERADRLGKWGLGQWTPEAFERHGMAYRVVWIEEATKVLEDAKTTTELVQEARSAGISVIMSQQKSTHRQMNTDVRSQLGGSWCFGVKDLEDAEFILSDEALAAGARPDRWKNRQPGCSYLEGPGIDESRYAIPARGFDVDDSDLAAALDTTGPDQIGDATMPDSDEPMDDFDIDPDDLDDDLDDEIELPAEDSEDGDLTDDGDIELPDVAELPLPTPRPSLAEARRQVAAWLTEQQATGRSLVGPKDVPDAIHGRSRPWVSVELARLAEDGTLVPTGRDGIYTYPSVAHAA
ncbi:FtsK/SpoIIIE domain-containing protein [Actinoalloteichus hymeniacidonis]|uniref:FtsK/SpoIIIE family protein n=1 Tax=Actinoalloteichus hymeniacidonis TaxID=340345 RepID=A0AAC9HTC3_9PSEU|nr:hypothetical protein [Actinoalloteichus hymeniacidonis]AOS65005.1 hypothetical protein TL08_21075 [Actinoalloteichus hymeniacidonis]MBB5906918.1 hypothetical protein [Actinoalloteichus hymeniacidonis]